MARCLGLASIMPDAGLAVRLSHWQMLLGAIRAKLKSPVRQLLSLGSHRLSSAQRQSKAAEDGASRVQYLVSQFYLGSSIQLADA